MPQTSCKPCYKVNNNKILSMLIKLLADHHILTEMCEEKTVITCRGYVKINFDKPNS